MRKLLEFLRMERSNRNILMSAAVILAGVRVGIAVLPFHFVLRAVNKLSSEGLKRGKSGRADLNGVGWTMDTASRHLPFCRSCLPIALAAKILGGYHGFDLVLHIGVSKGQKGELKAHAWVEYDGNIVVGEIDDMDRYTHLPHLS